MTTTYTSNARLQLPADSDRNWGTPLRANEMWLDGVASIGQLVVVPTETPSATLHVKISGGRYAKADGSVGTYAGTSSLAVSASVVTAIWLTDSGSLTTGSVFPTTAHIPLATVTAGATTITSVTDQRVASRTLGTGYQTVQGTLTVQAPGGSTLLAANPATPAIGFFGATPATQASAFPLLTDSTGGTASTTIADVGSTFSQSAINNALASLTAHVNALHNVQKRHGLLGS